MNCSVIGVIAITSASVFIAPGLAGVVFGLRGACLVGCVCTMSQPTILTRAEAGHECREGRHRLRLFLAEVAGKPFVADAVFEGR